MDYWMYISLLAAAIAVYAMVDILMARIANNRKMVWFALIVIIPIVGPMIYLLKKRSLVEQG
jgi:uncharacterized membrane protein YhaH (DUF805 family)